MNQRRRCVLYVSYDGLLEPLGQSQVWQYVSGLSGSHRMLVLSFEKAQDWADEAAREGFRAVVRSKQVVWVPLRYHRRPSAMATAFDILVGTVVSGYMTLRHGVRIVHARSYVSAVIALALKAVFGTRFLFDMRGFWADERVDGGLWPPDGVLYRAAKWFEKRFLLNADCVVSLTRAAVEEMRRFPYLSGREPAFEVIPTCADLTVFAPVAAAHSGAGPARPFTLGYVGSVRLWYLFDEALTCFRLLRSSVPDAQMSILNRGDHAYIRERLTHHNIPADAVVLEAADPPGVARAMSRMDAGIFFIRPVYSKIASAPTKLGEFLGCGVPCLGNAGVGDMGAILEENGVGVALAEFGEGAMRDGIERMLGLAATPGIQQRCREVAQRHFSLETGIQRYAAIYRDLVDSRHG